ncbi:MAG: LAGLIDADG family homing endonuclease [Paludibacteraceae bacterium]|nr:LAGLIDADG family homing endonuclease [Paludibacteraceae bacterium]
MRASLLEMTYGAFDNRKIENLGLYDTPTPWIFKAYLLGVLHDATARKYTYRVSQKSLSFIKMLKEGINKIGYNAWFYKEGKNRDVYVVEFARKVTDSHKVTSLEEKIAYIRGYFDTEGGIPRKTNSRYYIYFAQKDKRDLLQVKRYLADVGIACGKTHNPSILNDPEYFRFYILSKSHNDFAQIIGSWHPEKIKYLRMKI